jgi:ATP-dependent Clp protease ATP-binding subunit ClpA
MDEAASSLRIALENKPPVLDEAHRRIMRLEIEKEALTKELVAHMTMMIHRPKSAFTQSKKKLQT